MSVTYVLENLPTTSPVSVKLYQIDGSKFALTSTDAINGGVESTYIYSDGATNVETKLVVRYTVDKQGVKHVTLTLSTLQVVTDSVLGEISRAPVQYFIGFNVPGSYMDVDLLFKGLTTMAATLIGELTSGESDSDATADLYRGVTNRYPWG